MALFFDSAWFDARLSTLGMRREDVASVLGLTASEVADLWKDQRELKANDVRLLSSLLGVPANEVADRAGISTPVPREASDLDGLSRRLANVEAQLSEIRSLLVELKDRLP